MESVNYNELATLVLALCCIVVLLTFGVVYAVIRIGQIQKDFVREDGTLYDYIAQEKKKIAKEEFITTEQFNSAVRFLTLHIDGIKERLNKPLYEVGNTVWYNKGKDGTPGVHQDIKGKIISIEPSIGEPFYNVINANGIEENIYQSAITAWTN